MELNHRFVVPATLDHAWAVFNRLELIAPCYPGATVSGVTGDDYVGALKVKLGPFPLAFAGTARVVHRDARHHRLRIEASGIDRRGSGDADAKITMTFHGGGTTTDIHVLTELKITGRPAQLGASVVNGVSNRLLDQFVSCIGAKLEAGLEVPALAEVASGGPAGPGPAAAAKTFTPVSNLSQPDVHVVTSVLSSTMRHYGPQIAGGLVLLGITLRLVKRWRR